MEGIGVGHENVVLFVRKEGEFTLTGSDPGFHANLLYEDVGGLSYATEIEYDVGRNAFTSRFSRSG